MTDKTLAAGTRWFSLRRRLLLWLLSGITAGWLAALVFTYYDAHHEIDEVFDAQLAQMAQTLLALASEYDDDDDVADARAEAHKYQRYFVFQLWDDEGRLVLRSPQAPLTPLTTREGFSDADGANGQAWRYYSQWDRQRQLRAVVAENHAVREEMSGYIASSLLWPLLIGLPILGAWLWFATRRGLAPLDAIAAEVTHRAPERLDPVAPIVAPQELRPLIEALNALFGRVAGALEAERRFTADAAHELRTPLAAIVAQAQVAQRAREAAERDHALDQIAAGARRAGRLVDQLLTLARLDPAAGIALAPLRLDELAAKVCADHGATAIEKDIALELDAPVAVTVAGHADLLAILLRNLLDNALRYTPAGGRVVVKVGADGTAAELVVADDGPGIPAAERENALKRFRRLAGQEIAGSGLGLSIVARIAKLHGAPLTLEDNQPGLRVRLRFSFPSR